MTSGAACFLEGPQRLNRGGKCSSQSCFDSQFAHFGPEGTVLPKVYSRWAKSIRNMKVRPDDTWVITLPKCGTTWAQEMVWLLGNGLNFQQARSTYLPDRFPFLEISALHDLPEGDEVALDENNNEISTLLSMEIVDKMPSPRFIKTHLPLSLLPLELLDKQPKIIYVSREFKDVCVSTFHHRVLLTGYTGSLEQFIDIFVADHAMYSPFVRHVQAFQDLHLEQHPNLLYLTFEEMKSDLTSVILKTAKFMGKELSQENLDDLRHHLSFEEMKKNPAVNYEEVVAAAVTARHQNQNQNQPATKPQGAFIRKGQVGGWRNELSPKMAQKLDEWMAKNEVPIIS